MLGNCICYLILITLMSGSLLTPNPVSALAATKYFVDDKGSGTACSQSAPCTLSTALTKPESAFDIYLAAGTYTGSGNEVVRITKNISLLGGWNGELSITPLRDPSIYPTILSGGNSRRVVTIEGSIAKPLTLTIDGLAITQGDATGLIDKCSGFSASGCGGGIFIYAANVEVANNRIIANKASADPDGELYGYGGGLYARYCDGSQIHDNRIYNNTGNTIGYGKGGGIYLDECNNTTGFFGNDIYQNNASISPKTGWGSGFSSGYYDETHIYSNHFYNNSSLSPSNIYGSALYTHYSKSVIEKNRFDQNHNGSIVSLSHNQGSFTSNWILDNNGDNGLVVQYGEWFEGGDCTEPEYLEIVNNVIGRNGLIDLLIYGSEENQACTRVYHNTIDGNETGIKFLGYFGADLINNIVSNQSSTGIDISSADSSPNVDYTLFYSNGSNGYMGTHNLSGDPKYINAMIGSYHIWCDSAAYNTALAGYATNDIDGQTRPLFISADIGADECAPFFFLPIIAVGE